jgi:hypothetical protein
VDLRALFTYPCLYHDAFNSSITKVRGVLDEQKSHRIYISMIISRGYSLLGVLRDVER